MTEPAPLRDRTVIRISGEDRRTFLQGLITQDIEKLTPGRAVFTALLTPQGKILFDFFLVDGGDDYQIDCDRNGAEAIVKRLTLYKLRAKVSIAIEDTLAVATSQTEIDATGAITYGDPRHTALGWRAMLRKTPTNIDHQYDERRIALGVPEFGKDFDPDEKFLLDVNYDALNGVNYSKGCFVGQEVTSRMKRKGGIRKRTLIAEFDGPAPAKGAAVTAGDSTLGEILSGVKNRALALIRLDRWEKAKATGVAPICQGRTLRLSIPEYLKQD